jgi:hypothetical protein
MTEKSGHEIAHLRTQRSHCCQKMVSMGGQAVL